MNITFYIASLEKKLESRNLRTHIVFKSLENVKNFERPKSKKKNAD